jgi:PKD repeat protein
MIPKNFTGLIILSLLAIVPQQSFAAYTEISAHVRHTCALKNDGAVVCWGSNSHGQTTPPAGVFTQISTGAYFSCALRSNGSIACWGEDSSGQATPPNGVFSQVSAGGSHACALKKNDGSVVCWGANHYGQATPPAGVFTKISAGGGHNCALTNNSNIVCWGHDDHGQTTPPAGVFTQIELGYNHSCALKSNGIAVCWGNNSDGQATSLSGVFSQVSAGMSKSCALKSNGNVACWGKEIITETPEVFSQISVGYGYTCALKINGDAVCWGDNSYGQATPPTNEPSQAGNKPPKASFTVSPRQGNAPFTVSLNASLSFDPDGNITNYQWSASDGQTANGKNSQLTFNNPGTYKITLTVTDDKGATTSIDNTITVTQQQNQDPKASFTMSSQGNTVILNASSSFDPDGSITAYQWSSSNGQAASGQHSQLTFSNPGTYTIILTVTDDKGATNSTQKSITFNQPSTTTATPTTNNENVAALKFIDYEPLYQVGEMLKLNLQAKIIQNRNQRVDLWVSLQMPTGGILYMTPKITELFSTKAQPFIKSVERIDESYRILQLQVPEGIGGNYTLSAIFIKEGKNFIKGGPTVIKSNIAIAEIVLSNR